MKEINICIAKRNLDILTHRSSLKLQKTSLLRTLLVIQLWKRLHHFQEWPKTCHQLSSNNDRPQTTLNRIPNSILWSEEVRNASKRNRNRCRLLKNAAFRRLRGARFSPQASVIRVKREAHSSRYSSRHLRKNLWSHRSTLNLSPIQARMRKQKSPRSNFNSLKGLRECSVLWKRLRSPCKAQCPKSELSQELRRRRCPKPSWRKMRRRWNLPKSSSL